MTGKWSLGVWSIYETIPPLVDIQRKENKQLSVTEQ